MGLKKCFYDDVYKVSLIIVVYISFTCSNVEGTAVSVAAMQQQ